MPTISRNAGKAKTLMCDTMFDLMKKKVGQEIHLNFKGTTPETEIVWRRIQ